MKTYIVTNRTTGAIVAGRIKCADTSMTRLFGLLGRPSLNAGEGLWIRPSSGIHTVGMRFTIDAVGLDASRRVARLWPQMNPYRLSSVSLKVKTVLELAGGEIHARTLEIGHQLEFVEVQDDI